MELSALAPVSTATVDLTDDLELFEAADVAVDSLDQVSAEPAWSETVVVHVQLRPRRPATRRCLAALAALAARHPEVPFALTGLSGDDRVVRVTVGVELGPRELIAKFSDEAQAAYAFVDGLFTDLYDFMPVYVGEPGETERAAAAGVLRAADAPRPRTPAPRSPMPRIPSPRAPMDTAAATRRAVPVPA
ncbi:hypothetical protein [Modestobacter lacusdianchii]